MNPIIGFSKGSSIAAAVIYLFCILILIITFRLTPKPIPSHCEHVSQQKHSVRLLL